MTPRRISKRPHTLTRTRDDGSEHVIHAPTERAARSAMLYALFYSAGMSKRDANTAADSIEVAEPVTHGRYTFTLTATSKGPDA